MSCGRTDQFSDLWIRHEKWPRVHVHEFSILITDRLPKFTRRFASYIKVIKVVKHFSLTITIRKVKMVVYNTICIHNRILFRFECQVVRIIGCYTDQISGSMNWSHRRSAESDLWRTLYFGRHRLSLHVLHSQHEKQRRKAKSKFLLLWL